MLAWQRLSVAAIERKRQTETHVQDAPERPVHFAGRRQRYPLRSGGSGRVPFDISPEPPRAATDNRQNGILLGVQAQLNF